MLIVGDLKYFAQLQGRDNMSGSWCMWCMSHPNDWKLHPVPDVEYWTVQKIKERKEQLDAGLLREPSSIRGIVNDPIWDFIEP